jgi:hypothetical protein
MSKPIQLFTPLPAEQIAARERVQFDALAKFGEGAPSDDLIPYLHQRGLSIIESILVVRNLRDLGLGDAKVVVSVHPIWASVVAATVPLHEALIADLEADPNVIWQHEPTANGTVPNTQPASEQRQG